MKSWVPASVVFVLFSVFGYAAHYAIGRVYGSGEAIRLVEALSRSGLYLGSATATAAATTLALMLTLIGMMRQVDYDFDKEVYRSVNRIAQLATAAFMASLTLLLTLVFPIGEFDALPSNWYPVLFDILFAGTVLVVALLAATVTMLYQTIHYVIAQITPGEDI